MAERKVVQSRELLDTIVKENKGCNINKVGPLQHDPAAAKRLQKLILPVFIIYYWLELLTLSSCLWNYDRFWQICPDGYSCQQAEVKSLHCWKNQMFLMCLPVHHVLFCCSTESCRRTWCAHTQQVETLLEAHRSSWFFTFQYLFVASDKSSAVEHILFAWRTHVGVGNPLSPERTRMLLALRINVLAKGYSGISLETLRAMIQAFNGKPKTHMSHSTKWDIYGVGQNRF